MGMKPRRITLYQLKVQLLGVTPSIWRRIVVPASLNLEELHMAVQGAMGWTNSHLHQFVVDGTSYTCPDFEPFPDQLDERQVTLGQVAEPGDAFVYEYDYGDGWEHAILVEEAYTAPFTHTDSLCIGGARACPPEDCGGPYGYEELLAALGDKTHPRHQEFADWIDSDWKAEAFDHVEATIKLQTSLRRLTHSAA